MAALPDSVNSADGLQIWNTVHVNAYHDNVQVAVNEVVSGAWNIQSQDPVASIVSQLKSSAT